jgi:hypothetical protein
MCHTTSSHFAKYFCDTYSECITPYTVMTYATSDATWFMPPRLRTLRWWATVWSVSVDNTTIGSKRKLANRLSYSEHWINFQIIYCLLYMLKMQVYHNSDHMPDSGQRIWLRLYIPTPVTLSDSDRRHNFRCISWLRSHITAPFDERAACLTTSAVKDFAWSG